MAQIIIANLPTTSEINPESFVIIERPGIGQGTYKSTVRDLQEAITVHATVEQEDDVTTIRVQDINGTTEETIVTPTATITDNGDNTATITITDTHGVTSQTIVSRVVLDPLPTQGSPNMVTSGVIYSMKTLLEDRIGIAEGRIMMLESREDTAEDRLDAANRRMDAIEDRLDVIESRLEIVEDVSDRALMVEDTYEAEEPYKVNGVTYDDLSTAILAAAEIGGTVRLISNATSSGISIPEGSDFTLNLNGCKLKMVGPGSGSPGTKTLGMQLLMGSNITIKNGTLEFDDPRLKMGIQNYCNLTLDNVRVTGGSTITYVVSNNHGDVVFKNGTTIIASSGRVAFDVWYGLSPSYYDGVNVTIADSSVQVTGKIEFGKQGAAPVDGFAQHASLTCPTSMDLNVTLLNTPCTWTDMGTGYKTLRYTP